MTGASLIRAFTHGTRAPLLLLSLVATAHAQVSDELLVIGGSEALGCQNSAQPPELSNGTLASARIRLVYDASTAILTLEVVNDSPVVPGEPNPLLTQIALNLPANTVTGASLISQTSASGAPPAFALRTDPTNVGFLPMGCFGTFEMLLFADVETGAIGNPNADTWVVPQTVIAMSTVRLDIQLVGPGANWLTAEIIGAGVSRAGQLAQPNAACKFEGGGPGGRGSGLISSSVGANINPNFWITAAPKINSTLELCVSGEPEATGYLLASFNPTPTTIGPIVIPIGPPFANQAQVVIPNGGTICVPVQIPNEPSLVGTTIYWTFATITGVPSPFITLEFTPRFDMKILPLSGV